ncbi:CubicO group peptidase (beta-lactamase class C family) [Kordia periserrulae]|uniref:CubicO group peptidase (Beta-lactamase class C family) n=2 Tax=Kordia periserrulae TaxID=701523 RepID=A0A2T6C2V0_9FLAO|nr:CubicO group peptidase (beta-lactamase class C family) [Kordia periserrulae]
MIFIAFLVASMLTFGQELTNEQRSQLDKIVTQDVPKDAPGAAVGIVKNGKIIYTKYAGYANLEDSLKIDKNSRFNIASNGKQFTAFAILTLAEKGKLSLEDDIRKYFPNLYKNIQQPIKIKHLLNHSSGIREVYRLWSLQGFTWWKQQFSNADAMKLLQKQEDLNFTPGSKHLYSNSNYILLAEIVEKVAGISFVTYTNQMFQKLGMPNTSFVDDYTNIKGQIAKPYFNFETWSTYDWTCNIHGDGNLFTTLEDQLQWEKTIQTLESNHFSKEILAKSQQLIPNTNIDSYGYGLEFDEYKNEKYRYHAGATGAWKAITARFDDENFSVVTMINTGKIVPMMQAMQLADVLLGKKEEKADFPIVPASVGAKVSTRDILGLYRTDGGYTMEFEERNGKLYMIRSGRNDIELLREADNIFHQWNDKAFKQEFTKNSDGVMQITAYYPTVPPFTLTRIESDLSQFDVTSLNGSFQNSETDTSLTIKHEEDNTYKITIGKRQMEGLLIYENELLANNYNLSFEKDEEGNINEILVSADRIKNVRYKRK